MTTPDDKLVSLYLELKGSVSAAGYQEELDWAASIEPPQRPEDFACEVCWAIINSGLREQVARGIWIRVRQALWEKRSAHTEFGHAGKADAIDWVWANRVDLHERFAAATDKLRFLYGIPWIGKITQYHAAKNLGVDCCKPDRHLVRISGDHGLTPDELCHRVARRTGDRITLVDTVFWRAANLGFA